MSFKKSVPENYLKLQNSMLRRLQLCSRIEVVIPNKAFKLGTNSGLSAHILMCSFPEFLIS